ncbi:MAG TPA: DUF4266 domain-containing protein [Kofleriaceae bacterium]|nr:DUF4266 domain-containing protein [Kofleriaceae bacterium]
MSRLRVAVLAAVICSLGLTTGCAVVRPHERQNLARRTMTEDRPPGYRRFQQHQTGSREGADGGTGEPGGGCGCN